MTTQRKLKTIKNSINKISSTMKGGHLTQAEMLNMKDKEVIELDLIRGRNRDYITKLSSDNLNEFSSMLSSNKKVKEISLRNYDQPEEVKPTIDDILKITLSSLKKTTTLAKLDLNWSSFHDKGFNYLSNFIKKNNTLKELYIGDCVNIELENLNNFIQTLSQNTSLLVCDYYGHYKDTIMPQITQIMRRNKEIFNEKFTRQLQKDMPKMTQDSVEYLLKYLKYKDYPMLEHNKKNNNNNNNNNLNMTFMKS